MCLRKTLVLFSVFVLVFFSFLKADVVYKSKTVTSGMMGIGEMETETVTKIKEDKKREESKTKFTGGMMEMMMKGKVEEEITITRLDKKLIWRIDPQEKKYTETTFDQMKKMMEMIKAQKPEEEEEKVEVKTTLEVNRTENKKKIAGYECEEILLKMITEGKDQKTGEKGKFIVEIQMWVSPDVKGSDEVEAFNKKMAKKLGMEEYGKGFLAGIAQYGVDVEAIKNKIGEIKGFPLMTVVSMKPEMEIKPEEKEELEEEEEEEYSEMEKKIMEKMGLLGKGEKSEEEGFLFKITTTVEEIKKEAVADSEFELPKGLTQEKFEMEFK